MADEHRDERDHRDPDVLGFVIGIRDKGGDGGHILQTRPRASAEHLRRQYDGYGGRMDVDVYELRRVVLPPRRERGGR